MKEDVLLRIRADVKHAQASIDKIGKQFSKFGKTVEAETKALQRRLRGILDKAAVGLAAFSTTIGVGLGKAAESAAQFEQLMRNVNTIAKDTERDFSKISDSVISLATEKGLAEGPTSLAAALYDINSAGIKSKEGLKVLEVSSKAATAGLTSTDVAAKGIVVALNSYGKSANEAGRLADIMFKTVEEGIITFPTLSGNLGKVTAVANAAGVSMEEVGAGMAQMTARGLSAEEAAIALRGAILKMLAPTEAQKKAAKEYGIEIGASALASKGFAGVLADIEKKTGGSKDAIFKIVGEVRAFNGALNLIGNDGGKSYIDRIERFRNSSGALSDALGQQEKALSTQFKKLKAQVEAAAIRIGNAFLPALKNLVQALTGAVSAFNALTSDQQKVIAYTVAISGAVAGLSASFIFLTGVINASSAALIKFGSSSVAGSIGKIGRVLGSIGTFLSGISSATIAAFAAVVGAIVVDFGGLRTSISEVFSAIKDSVNEILGIFDYDLSRAVRDISGLLVDMAGVIGFITESTVGLANAFLTSGIVGAINVIGASLKTVIQTVLDLKDVFVAFASHDVEKIIEAGDKLEANFLGNLENIGKEGKGFFSNLADRAVTNLQRAEDRFSDMFSSIEEGAEGAESRIGEMGRRGSESVDRLSREVKSLSDSFFGVGNTALDTFGDMQAGFNKLVEDLSNTNNFGPFFDQLAKMKKEFKEVQKEASLLSKITGAVYESVTGGNREFVGPIDDDPEKSLKIRLKHLDLLAAKELRSAESVYQEKIKLLEKTGGKEIEILRLKEKHANEQKKRQEKLDSDRRKSQDKAAAEAKDNPLGRQLAERMRSLVGTSRADINRSEGWDIDTAACAITVQRAAKLEGLDLPASVNPLDANYPSSPSLANFANSNEDYKLFRDKSQAQLGDLVQFANTYGDFAKGAITHIGVITKITDGLIEFTHQSGQSVINSNLEGYWESKLASFSRPKSFDTEGAFRESLEQLQKSYDFINEVEAYAIRNIGRLDSRGEVPRMDASFGAIGPGIGFSTDEINNIFDMASPDYEAQKEAYRSLIDEQIRLVAMLEEAGVLSRERELENTRDLIANKLALDTDLTEERLASMAKYRAAEVALRDLRLEELEADRALSNQTDEEYKAKRDAIVLETEQKLRSIGVTATKTTSLLSKTSNKYMVVLKQFSHETANHMKGAFDSFVDGALNGQINFSNIFRNLWQNLAKSTINALIAMMTKTKAYIAIMSVLKGLLASVFGLGGGGALAITKKFFGFAHEGGVVPSAHTGGLVGRSINPLPDELLTLLQSGESVLPRDATNNLLDGSAAIYNQGQGGFQVQEQHFHGANPYEFAQIMGRELDSEFASRPGF